MMRLNRWFLSLALAFMALLPAQEASAQFEDTWWLCEPSGQLTQWTIVNSRWGRESSTRPGYVIFADDCIEIKDTKFLGENGFRFPVGKYERKSTTTFVARRREPDDIFDYIEVVKVGKQWRIMMGKLKHNDALDNTIYFTCKPNLKVVAKNVKEAMNTTPKGDGMPPQVKSLRVGE